MEGLRVARPLSAALIELRPEAPIGAFRAPSDLQDNDDVGRLIDEIYHPEITDTKPPEVRAGKLHDTWRVRLDGQGQDRSAESRCITGG